MHLGICMWWRRLAEVQTEHQNGKKGDLSDFERGMVIGARWAGYGKGNVNVKNMQYKLI